MSTNPYSPDYDPPVTGPLPGGPVGHGSDFGVHLYTLYNAGRIQFPVYGERWYDAAVGAARADDAIFTLNGDTGYPAALSTLESLRAELEQAMFVTAKRMYAVGEALVQIADEYVRTDDDAAREFDRLYPRDQDAYDHVPHASAPPTSDPTGPLPTLPDAYPRRT